MITGGVSRVGIVGAGVAGLSLPNQTYNCHNSWNWSTKSFVFTESPSSISYSLPLLCEAIACLCSV
jgi:hypothetical protein